MPPKYAKAQALDRKAQAQEEQDRKIAEQHAREEEASWAVGSNEKAAARQRELDEKAAAKAAAKALSNSLLEQEIQSVAVAGQKKTKKKGKDDVDKLNEALAAMPMSKAQKEAAAAKKRKEDAIREEEERRRKREQDAAAEEINRKTAAARGIVIDHGSSLMVENTNRALGDDDEGFEHASGLDSAIDLLTVSGPEDKHPERRQKALYQAYYERNLPLFKESHPGLKLSQYKERIFDQWEKSPENPRNGVSGAI